MGVVRLGWGVVLVRRLFVTCSLVLGLLAACSSEPETPLGSGVDPDKSLSEVTDEERVDVCEAADAYSLEQATRADACLYQVLSDSRWAEVYSTEEELADISTEELRTGCRNSVDHCVEVGLAHLVENQCWFTEACAVHVEEFEECLISVADELAETVAQLPSCEELTHEKVREAQRLLPPPFLGLRGGPACDVLAGLSCGWLDEDEFVAAGGAAGAASE